MINYKIKNNAKKLKYDIIDMYKMGQGCAICRYNKCGAALEFHHVDKEEKTDSISAMINRDKSMSEILEEIKKCIILCANCHRELHNK